MSDQRQRIVAHHLRIMMDAEPALYAQCLDAGDFTRAFNRLIEMAGGSDDLMPTEPPGNGGRSE